MRRAVVHAFTTHHDHIVVTGVSPKRAFLNPLLSFIPLKTYAKAVSEGCWLLIDAGYVDPEPVLDAAPDHKAEIVVHNQVEGHLKKRRIDLRNVTSSFLLLALV